MFYLFVCSKKNSFQNVVLIYKTREPIPLFEVKINALVISESTLCSPKLDLRILVNFVVILMKNVKY